ncbi:hypothetical protein CIK05_00915 [Bdellovibrio sp. qaytius]|nr:hypothetical protein CIK05_00915 [Bdellovibrio sp. qaytius]
MSDEKKNMELVPAGDTTIANTLANVDISGNYTGGNSINAKYYLPGVQATQVIEHIEFLETFSARAAEYIVNVAFRIAEQSAVVVSEDLGFENEKLNEKFKNMNCTPTYRSWFNEHATNFSMINHLRETDSFQGKTKVIRGVVGLIRQLYLQLLDKHDNGDKIHNAIFIYISRHALTEEQAYATHSLIFYVINECGIFNEKK